MGLLANMKEFFTKSEVTEETFTYESIDSYMKKRSLGAHDTGDEDVIFKCDQIVDATYQLEGLRAEYDMVTSYFTDIQTIEELPPEVRQEITDVAKKIAVLEKESSAFLQSDDRISDENFRMLQGIEKELSEIFGRLKELEDMDALIKRDMQHLENEKQAQEKLQEQIMAKQEQLRKFLLSFGLLAALTVLILAAAGVAADTSLLIPILIILLVVAGLAALSIVAYKNMAYEYKLSEVKENRAISLMNKVKIKYINNTSTLQYLYEKYHIKSLRELEYLYDQYLVMVDEVRRYQKTTGDLRQLSDALSKLLFACGVKDPEIWMKQSLALVDRREMVEVKHTLNVRRQKLREQLAYNEELRINGLKEIKEMLKGNPRLREQVRQELHMYHINLQ